MHFANEVDGSSARSDQIVSRFDQAVWLTLILVAQLDQRIISHGAFVPATPPRDGYKTIFDPSDTT